MQYGEFEELTKNVFLRLTDRIRSIFTSVLSWFLCALSAFYLRRDKNELIAGIKQERDKR